MDTDLMFVVGIFSLVLAIPSFLSSWSDSSPPRTSAILFLIGGVLLALALTRSPTGYRFEDVPDVIFRVIGRYF